MEEDVRIVETTGEIRIYPVGVKHEGGINGTSGGSVVNGKKKRPGIGSPVTSVG